MVEKSSFKDDNPQSDRGVSRIWDLECDMSILPSDTNTLISVVEMALQQYD